MFRTRIKIGILGAALAAFGSVGVATPAHAVVCNDDFLGPDVSGEGELCNKVLATVCYALGGSHGCLG